MPVTEEGDPDVSELKLAFYGDDFTGSTDVLESLSLNGVETILFIDPPGEREIEELGRLGDVQAIGVAGTSRSMTPTEMDEELSSAFSALDEFVAPIVQYKVCSTFDSSPEIGSIGHAIDLGQDTFDSPFVPVVVAAPSLEPRGRYVVFGNMFATVDGTTYRLDRHPAMRDHPVTPMTEADLGNHLAKQTDLDIDLLDLRSLDAKSGAALTADLDTILAGSAEIVFFDGLNHEHQRKVGRLVWEQALETDGSLFVAASSGLNYALTSHWQETGAIKQPEETPRAPAVDQLIVMSGSASPINARQIDWALNNGFEGVRLDTARLVAPDEAEAAREEAIKAALTALNSKASVLLYSAHGPDDPAIEETNRRLYGLELNEKRAARRLGTQQGKITRTLLAETGHSRVCIAGGDTSGFVAPVLDIFALEFIAPVGPGSPLCQARSLDPQFDGLEIALKGGQVQTTHDEPDYFGAVRDGGTPR